MENRDVNLLWESVKADLAPKISTIAYQVWVSGATPLRIYNNKLVLSVELRKTKIQLDTVFRDKIVDCIRKNSDFVDDFIVITPDDAAEYG